MKKDNLYLTSALNGKINELRNSDMDEEKKEKLFSTIKDVLLENIKTFRKKNVGPKRAKFIHAIVDSLIHKSLTAQPELKEKISCRKGCSFCCHQLQIVNADEAMLLANKAKQLNIDLDLLHEQADWIAERYDNLQGCESDWFKITPEKTKCVFLDSETKECRVYEDRPSSCRNYFVISEPKDCSYENPGQTVKQVFLMNAQVCQSASLNLEGKRKKVGSRTGFLPFMIRRYL